MEGTSQVTSSELDYSKKSLLHPKYKLSQIYPQSGLQTQTLTSAGGQEIIFQLPVKVFNLSKSVLRYTLTPSAASGAGNNYVAYRTPLQCIRQIQLYTQSGVYLCDLYYVNKYLNTVFYPETKIDDFLELPISNVTTATVVPTIGTFRSNQLANGTTAGLQAGYVVADADLANPAVTAATVNYTEKTYLSGGSARNSTNPVISINFDMKNIMNTIFSMDKDLFIGEVLQLRIVFDSSDTSYYFLDTAGDDTTVLTGAAAMGAHTVAVSNIAFYLAIEQDLGIAQQIIDKASTGLTIPIPFVYSYKTNLSSTSQSLSLRFNRAHGRKLRKIYHAPYCGTENIYFQYYRENLRGAKTVTSFYTLLNNERLQEFNVDTTQFQDYMLLSHKLDRSAIQSVQEYQYGWFWVEDFTSEGPLWSHESQDITLSSGIPLDSEQKWDIFMTMANARAQNHYNFAVTEKTLLIQPGAIIVQ